MDGLDPFDNATQRERSDHNILSLEGQMCCKIKNGEMLWDAVRGGWPL